MPPPVRWAAVTACHAYADVSGAVSDRSAPQILLQVHDLDGVERAFDGHGRFTPGKGRIHFGLIGEQLKAEIAYVGSKL